MKRSGMIRQPIRNGMRQPHTTISSGGTSALKSTPRSATKMTATCWLPDCQLTYSSHRHEQHADNDNRPVLAESQQNFSWRGMVRVTFYFITAYTPTFGREVLKLSNIDSLIVKTPCCRE